MGGRVPRGLREKFIDESLADTEAEATACNFRSMPFTTLRESVGMLDVEQAYTWERRHSKKH
jgi:hypothetical protein